MKPRTSGAKPPGKIGITRNAQKKLRELYVEQKFGKRAIATRMTRSRFKTATGKDTWHPIVVERYLKHLGVFEPNRPSRDAATVFAQRVVKDRTTECHLWIGARDIDGYGMFRGQGAHRFAYEQHSKSPLGDRHLHHICRHRPCVNPLHLVAVTDRAAHAVLARLEREHVEYVLSEEYVAEVLAHEGDAVLAACA
jgi:hypothetical protein